MEWDFLPQQIEEGSSIKQRTRPEIFNYSFIDDPSNYIYLKLFQETRANTVNTDHSAPSLLMASLKADSLSGMKVGFKLNNNVTPTSISECISIHAYSKYLTNFSNVCLVKHSAFVRLMTMINPNIQLTASLSAA